ncbi:sensor histidine kinase N-terminal domain-containing protein [Brucella intermedia]|uniref:sensor histidine kinase n=1 Tax=Brucella TaxID=234 RepID=UPI00094632C0|nr:sensor histidine kinase [Brucella intermedia]
MKQPTLTWSLFVRVAPTILVALVFIGLLAFQSALREINHIYDAQLINDANVLWSLLQRPLQKKNFSEPRQFKDFDFAMEDQLALNEDVDDYADAHMFRVWKDGGIAVYSTTAFRPEQPLSRSGLADVVYDDELWRVYTLRIPGERFVVEVGEKIELRNTLASNILLNLVIPLLVLIPLIGVLMWFGIRRGLRTIHWLINQIRSRSPDDLSYIPTDGLPRDLTPLGRSVNQLMSKLDRSLTAERRFADHAAHQLRTPHAGLKLLLQMLQHSDNEGERKAIIASLVQSNEKALRLIEQLLQAGRVSHQHVQYSRFNLYDLAASVMAELGPAVRQKRLDITLDGVEDALVETDEPLLHLLVENLIENAIKYTPEEGEIHVSLHHANDVEWLLTICDTGPGIPQEQREAVFQRFYRVGSPQPEGSGLGLAIVADIAARLSVRVSLDVPANGRGLRVDLLIEKAAAVGSSSKIAHWPSAMDPERRVTP